MKMGAERKKVAFLAGLLVVAAVIFIFNSGEDSSSASQAARPPAAVGGGAAAALQRDTDNRPSRASRGSSEFRPSMRPRRGEERPDPMNIDPTLRLDVLAKLQQVKLEGPRRSIFDFSQPPAPPPDPKVVAAAKAAAPSPLVKPEDTPPETPKEPEKPKAPPIPLKFYGYISRSNLPAKRAFFMDGEEIHVVSEGELVKKRYKIVRIGVNSVVVEDTQFGQEQTLPLEEQPG